MDKQRWTPGPWEPPHLSRDDTTCNCRYVVEAGYAGAIATIHVGNGLPICDGGNDAPPLEEAKANGLLIAAAPALYAALEEAVRDWAPSDDTIEGQEVFNRARAALSAARGESV